MNRMHKNRITIGLLFLFIFYGAADPLPAKVGSAAGRSGSTALQQRIDFGNAYIMGQSIKSGAVYLMHRKQNEIKSMLEYRNDYRDEILEEFQIQNLKIDGTGKKDDGKKR